MKDSVFVAVAVLGFSTYSVAGDAGGLTLVLSKRNDSEIDLHFKNATKARVELEIPVEGAGDCDKYFDIEAVTAGGKAVRKSMLYGPGIPPYVVKLKRRHGL